MVQGYGKRAVMHFKHIGLLQQLIGELMMRTRRIWRQGIHIMKSHSRSPAHRAHVKRVPRQKLSLCRCATDLSSFHFDTTNFMRLGRRFGEIRPKCMHISTSLVGERTNESSLYSPDVGRHSQNHIRRMLPSSRIPIPRSSTHPNRTRDRNANQARSTRRREAVIAYHETRTSLLLGCGFVK